MSGRMTPTCAPPLALDPLLELLAPVELLGLLELLELPPLELHAAKASVAAATAATEIKVLRIRVAPFRWPPGRLAASRARAIVPGPNIRRIAFMRGN